MSIGQLVPRVRFDGFSGEWCDKKIKDLVKIVRGGSPRPINKYITQGEGYNWIRIGDANIKSNEIFNTKEKIIAAGLSKTRTVAPGDLLLSNSMSFGRPYITRIHGCIHDGWLLLNPIETLIKKEFLLQLFSSTQIQNKYKRLAAGSTVNNLNIELVSNVTVSTPNTEEQAKIGTFFQKLDRVIELQESLLNQYEQYKKAMLQKMFPKDGESKPEIRFKGFNRDWVKKKIMNISRSYSGGTPSASNKKYYKNGTIPFIRSGEIHELKTELYITESALANSSAKIVSKGDILYALYGATSGEVSISKIDGAINQAILCVQPKENTSSLFLLNILNLNKAKIIKTYLQGGQGNLSGTIIKNLSFLMPTQEEQTKIGQFFQALDKKIDLQAKKVEQYKNFKKAMLQKMFV